MDEREAFLTRTIVGNPCSILLGRRLKPRDAAARGIEVDLAHGQARLSEGWADLLLLGSASDFSGRPRRRPERLRRWIERHALVVAWLGLASLAAAAAILVWSRFTT